MRDIFLMLIIFGSIPFILHRPWIGILVWSWIGYMNPHRLSWTLQNFPVAALVGGALLVGLVFSREPKRLPWNSLTVTWVLFIVWMNVTTLFALFPDDAVAQWDKVMKIQLFSFITLMLIQSKERINWLVTTIVLSVGFFGFKGGIFFILAGGEYKVWGPPDSFIADNNALALALLMAIPLMRYLQTLLHQKYLRYGLIAITGTAIVSVLGSYSRGAFLGGFAMILWTLLKSRKKAYVIALLLIAIPIGISLIPEKWTQRMESIGEYQLDRSAMGRVNAWLFAYNLASERPLVGGGFNTFEREIFKRYAPDPDLFQGAHSIYFEILGEHGFVGLFLFLLLGFLAWRSSVWIMRNASALPDMRWAVGLANMCQLSLIGYAVSGAFLGLAYFDLYYHIVCLIVLTRYVVERRITEVAAGASSAAVAETPEADERRESVRN